MRQTYLEYLENDKELHRLLAPILPGLGRLSGEQLETLVFYLKSLHGYYPDTENDGQLRTEFDKKLAVIANSPVQKELERKAARSMFYAMISGGLAGVSLVVGALTFFNVSGLWGSVLIVAAIAIVTLGERLFVIPGINIAKEQDRRYFLECIRTARGCNELDWTGLFSYSNAYRHAGAQSAEDVAYAGARVAELSTQLRRALYNDEYMQYSTARPEGQAGTAPALIERAELA